MALIDVLRDRLAKKGVSEFDIDDIINSIRSIIDSQQYGLLWEPQKEDIVDTFQSHLPFFEEQEGIHNDNISQNHVLLEGDNLYALTGLQYTHRAGDKLKDDDGLIDVIYIDPPYNTGKRDFKYNDNYVNTEDQWKHSKWLSFMNKRLELAKNLLKKDGVIFISIDENEQAQLKLLCDRIFGEENRLSTHHIQVRYHNKSLNEDNDWQPVMEYVLIYAKNKSLFKANKPSEKYDLEKFKYSIKELTKGKKIEIGGKVVTIFKDGEWEITESKSGRIGLLKEIWASGSLVKQSGTAAEFLSKYLIDRKEEDGLNVLYKIHNMGEDGLGYRYVSGPKKANAIRGKYYSGVPLDRIKELEESGQAVKYRPISNYYDYSGDFGNIKSEGGISFNSGKKPIKMIKELINYHPNKNAIVLDFFAGSGSTGHAVMELNKEDGGNRQFILCTNNEINYDDEIKYFISKGKIRKEPKKNTLDHNTWEAEVSEFLSSKEYKKIIKSKEYMLLGICQSVTIPRLNNVMNKNNKNLKEKHKCINNNLYHYIIKSDIEVSPFKDVTIKRVIDKFTSYVAIKENCYIKKQENAENTIYESEHKVVVINKSLMKSKSTIIKESIEYFKCINNKEKILYSVIPDKFSQDGIRFIPYPQEILTQIESIKKEVR
ncbi:site-specific DNA-methyltransferase [uncultured Clostridium sp.]|uniref:site-specific DNA-methyltransferase n=1 Tax=uncultured Clostridium sp. TaxID=59620 RepID=UPI0027DC43EE|nr:site-specific DNA-methyltransferase [uncultured Clostridium sp.]